MKMKTHTLAVIAACLASGGLAAPTRTVSSQFSQQDIAALNSIANFKGDFPLNARQTNGLLEGLSGAMANQGAGKLKARQLDVILDLLSSQSGGQKGGHDETHIDETNATEDIHNVNLHDHHKRQLDILLNILDSQSGGQRGGSNDVHVDDTNIKEAQDVVNVENVDDGHGHHGHHGHRGAGPYRSYDGHHKRQLDVILGLLSSQSGGQQGGHDEENIDSFNENVDNHAVDVSDGRHHWKRDSSLDRRQLDVILGLLSSQSGGQKGGHDEEHIDSVKENIHDDEVNVHNHNKRDSTLARRQLDVILSLLSSQSGGQQGGHDEEHIDSFTENLVEHDVGIFDGHGNHHAPGQPLPRENEVHAAKPKTSVPAAEAKAKKKGLLGGAVLPGILKSRQLDIIPSLISSQSGGQKGGHHDVHKDVTNISEEQDIVSVANGHPQGRHHKRQLDIILDLLSSQSGGQKGGHDEVHKDVTNINEEQDITNIENGHHNGHGHHHHKRQLDIILDLLSSQSGGQKGGHDEVHKDVTNINEEQDFTNIENGHHNGHHHHKRQLDIILDLLSSQSGGQKGGHNDFHEDATNVNEREDIVNVQNGGHGHHHHKRQLDVILGLLSSQSGGQQGGHNDVHEDVENVSEREDIVNVENNDGHGHGHRHHKRTPEEQHPEESLNQLLQLVGVNGPPSPGISKHTPAGDAADTLTKLGKLSKMLTNNAVGIDVQEKKKDDEN